MVFKSLVVSPSKNILLVFIANNANVACWGLCLLIFNLYFVSESCILFRWICQLWDATLWSTSEWWNNTSLRHTWLNSSRLEKTTKLSIIIVLFVKYYKRTEYRSLIWFLFCIRYFYPKLYQKLGWCMWRRQNSISGHSSLILFFDHCRLYCSYS